jgi:hypothetical protein
MNPGAIIRPAHPKADADVKTAIAYAAKKGIAVAVRTGGHQYHGASSTSEKNIQLDLSEAYKRFDYNSVTGLVHMGISYSLGVLNKMLGEKGLFVPHGQCSHVHVGGHVHTGGYGLPGRAFGLFGDHVESIRIITADCEIRDINRNTTDDKDAALFYAVLGGSPGNFAVLTEITLKPRRDVDHPHAHGLKITAPYCSRSIENLLKIKAEMAKDEGLAKDYDLCITVMSRGRTVDHDSREGTHATAADPETAAVIDKSQLVEESESGFELADKFGFEDLTEDKWKEMEAGVRKEASSQGPSPRAIIPIPVIIVFAQWANCGGQVQVYNEEAKSFFKKIQEAVGPVHWPLLKVVVQEPMSKLTAKWVFPIQREFQWPYIKRTYVTKETKKLADGAWVKKTVERIDDIVRMDGCHVAVQVQHYGGKHSRFCTNDAEDRTAYSWRRDTTVVLVMDCFYEQPRDHGVSPKSAVRDWQLENDKCFIGKDGCFSTEDRRVLWGSYYVTTKEKNMGNAWKFYYDEEKYKKLCSIKREVDSRNVFTPNDFCVGVQPS